MLISEANPTEVVKFSKIIDPKLAGANTLEDAAQTFVQELHEAFEESIVLVRTFITIPMQELPPEIQAFANNLAKGAKIPVPLPKDAMILTLFGTSGEGPEWNDRKNSKGHVGIPLASASFVSSIPMISALLEQLGFDLGWLRGNKEIIAKSFGSLGGTFYVEDAPTTVDNEGRYIIANQEFVSNFGVHAVFGFGGGYTGAGKFMVTIIFCRENFSQNKATMFQALANIFKLKTSAIIKKSKQYFNSK